MQPNKQAEPLKLNDLWFLQIGNLWKFFKGESLAFKSICIYLFIEYFRPQSIFPVINFLPWAQIFLTLALVAFVMDKKAKLKFTTFHVLILMFAIAIHMSFLVAYNISWSTRNYIFFIQWIVVFYLATGIVNTKERLYVFFLVMFMCSLKVAFGTARVWAFRGFSFTTWGLMGPPGYFQNSGELAILMLILFPLGYMLYRDNKDSVRVWEKYVLLAAWVCPLLTILGSSSRGAQLALAVQLVVLFYKQIFKPKILIGATLLISIGWHILPDEQKERFTDIGEDKSSLQRKLYWKHGWDMMKEYPVLGVGYFNFIPYYRDHFPQDMLYGKAELPHNIFLQIGTDAGFTGLFFYLLVIIFALTKRLPNFPLHPDPGDKIMLAMWRGLRLGIIGFVMAGQFVTVGYYPFLWISLALQASLLLVYQNKQQGNANGAEQGLLARSQRNG